nr:MAG TPA: tail completion protein [Bacteriophage sp.]
MIDIESIRVAIVKGLREGLAVSVIRSNTANKLPKLPFLSYTITSLLDNAKSTWSRYDDLTDRIPATQMWSITLNAADFGECSKLAISAYDYFSKAATEYLKKYGIVILSVSEIVPRDNFLSVDYEYRLGFDVKLGLMNEISFKNETTTDDIEVNGRVIKNGGV